MKIWIDLTNSPHVNFFAGMVNELKKKHEILLTCRPLANTIELLELCGFQYYVVGKHYGSNKLKKILGFIVRISQLVICLRKKDIDVAISHSSFYSPVVSWMLRVRCIYLNDNEHAEGNRISFIFADKIMVPEFLDTKKVQKQWADKEKIIQYPGVKESVYLWYSSFQDPSSFKINFSDKKKVIFIRPEPWTAQYYKGERNFIDKLLIELKDNFKIILLPRDEKQTEYYKLNKFIGVVIPEKSISLNDIIETCDLFIGAGGTMTREAAVLGIPTISIYQDKLLCVDKYLIEKGFMIHKKNIDSKFVINYLQKSTRRLYDKQLLDKGKEAYELIKKILLGNNSPNRRER